MFKTTIYDLDAYPVNERNGTYGGKAGDKEAITINGEYWIVKYPKTTKDMKGDLDSYTTAPLSEYIGSHIYQILGIETHETILGIRENKLVVACKDFCKEEGALREIRTLKNAHNKQLSEALEQSFSSTPADNHYVDLETMMVHFKYNPMFNLVPDMQTRFWEQFIVDMFINNNDRNNGNWGVLYENGKYRLAPVFDNGASFSNKVPDRKLAVLLSSENTMMQSVASCTSVYTKEDHHIHGKDMVNITNECYLKTALDIIPKIKDKMDEIRDFINDIPEKCGNFDVCSSIRKQFYIRSMELKYEKYLLPVYELAENKQLTQSADCKSKKHKQVGYNDDD